MGPKQLTKNMYEILYYLNSLPLGCPRTEVMKDLEMQKSSWTEAEEDLISHGLIESEKMKGRGSPKYLNITEAGQMLLKAFKLGNNLMDDANP